MIGEQFYVIVEGPIRRDDGQALIQKIVAGTDGNGDDPENGIDRPGHKDQQQTVDDDVL